MHAAIKASVSDGNTIAGKPGHTRVQLASGMDPARMSLSAEEAQVVSRARNAVALSELVANAGLPTSKAELVVGTLLRRRLLIESEEAAAPDLTPERRAEIVGIEARLERNYFELLGVPNGAPAEACKQAYYQLSMRLHPDRFYGQDLGPFRPRVDRIFRKLTEAQAVLTDRDKRQAYQNAHPELFRAPTATAVHDGVRAEDRARRIARHPYLAKAARLHELLSRARTSIDANQPAQALIDLEQLLKLDPQNPQAKQLLSEAAAKKDGIRGQQVYEEGLRLLSGGDTTGATHRFLEALEKAPSREVCTKGCQAAVECRDFKSAKTFAQKWVELEPRAAKAHLALAEILERLGMQKNAKREAEEALKLDPDNKPAKALVTKLRWA